jgi:hypothetical protein
MNAETAIKSAMAVARDLAEGHLPVAELEAAAAAEAASMFSTVVGPGDPLWDTQVAVARRVLALGGVTADELREWLAVDQADTE